jgi:hypothetical protein
VIEGPPTAGANAPLERANVNLIRRLTYPFDVLRRKMQVTGMKSGAVKYNGALHALMTIVRTEVSASAS